MMAAAAWYLIAFERFCCIADGRSVCPSAALENFIRWKQLSVWLTGCQADCCVTSDQHCQATNALMKTCFLPEKHLIYITRVVALGAEWRPCAAAKLVIK